MSADALDLHDDEAVGVLCRHRQREIVERQRLALHGDVAAQVGGGAAEQRHRDGERFVEQPFLVIDLHHPHQVVGSAAVDLAALLARIDERAQPHLGQRAGPVSGDVAKQLAQRSERQVVGLDASFHRHRRELGHESPVPADRALDQSVPREAIQPAILAVPGCGGEYQRQIARRRRLRQSASPALAMSSSGVPLPTKPEKAMVSPSRMMAMASSVETILFFI